MQNELINGRTPEEIRKNIEGCSNGFGCDECPYEHETFERCGECIITDALAYIEHLEKKLAEATLVQDCDNCGEERYDAHSYPCCACDATPPLRMSKWHPKGTKAEPRKRPEPPKGEEK